MRKKTYKNLFISLLIILAFFANASVVLAAKPANPKGKKAAKKETQKKVTSEKKEEVVQRARTEIKYTGFESKRNPFAPPKEVARMITKSDSLDFEKIETVKIPKIDVQGIIWSKSMPQVIINGDVMKAGEYIDEFQIKEITQKGIILFHKGKEYLMKMQNYGNNQQKTKKRRKR